MELPTVLLIILAIFIAYFVFLYFTQTKDVPAKDVMAVVPAPSPNVPLPPVEPQRPQAEHEAPPQRKQLPIDAQMTDEEGPLDPYAENQEYAEIPERMRKPERMFRPAPDNDGVPVNSGLMGAPHSGVAGYASEMVQNEGEFMPGIYAFDTAGEGGNFSMF